MLTNLFQYGKTAKFYVYAPGELDLNVLIGRCKEMPRKRDPEGKSQKFKMLPSQQMQQEAYSHATPPKGTLISLLAMEKSIFLNKKLSLQESV